MSYDDTTMPADRVVDKIEYAEVDILQLHNQMFDSQLFHSLKLNIEDAIVRGMVLDMRATALGHRNEPQTIQYPTTWADAFKLRWFPPWLLRRYPAKETKVTLDSQYVLAECPWTPPPNGGPVRIAYTSHKAQVMNHGT